MRPALALSFLLTLFCSQQSHAQSITVDLELVLAIDSSRSVDVEEFRIQTLGIAAAFRDPEFLATLEQAAPRGIAVTVVQWAGVGSQSQAVEWQHITGKDTADEFATRIIATDRQLWPGGTAITSALRYSIGLIKTNRYQGTRLAIDISGDGYNNGGNRPELARDEAIALGITINGLTITNEVAYLTDYYISRVTGGPGAFVMEALDYQDFTAVFQRKLIREVTGENVYSMKVD